MSETAAHLVDQALPKKRTKSVARERRGEFQNIPLPALLMGAELQFKLDICANNTGFLTTNQSRGRSAFGFVL